MGFIEIVWERLLGGLKVFTDLVTKKNTTSVVPAAATAFTVNRMDLTNIFGALLIGVVIFFLIRVLLKDKRSR